MAKTEIQETELYNKFKKALNITMDMRADDNPFVVACCKIAEEYAQSKPSPTYVSDEEIVSLAMNRYPEFMIDTDNGQVDFNVRERENYKEGLKRMRSLIFKEGKPKEDRG